MSDMTQQNSPVQLPAFFDDHPELKEKLEAYLKTVPAEEIKENVEIFKKYINGEITWGEIRKISKRMQKELARVAFMKFKMQDYDKAETLFKGLAIIDHTNWYYRSALGAIYFKLRKYEDAINEYDIAIELKEDELSCWVNRGECQLFLKDFEEAIKDFEKVMAMDLAPTNAWYLRAKALMQRTKLAQREDENG
ncbi:hypothetical protein BVY03_01510 [bacterium K02(2017)]|nr:hypothetical protein BVY03_01510 [bacterium K02(2017)]